MTSANPQHRTVRLVTPSGDPVDIDEGIAPLVARLWQLGFVTTQCCQGRRNLASDPRDEGPERVWIEFETEEHAAAVVTWLVAQARREGATFDWSQGSTARRSLTRTGSVSFSPAALPLVERAFSVSEKPVGGVVGS